MINLPTPHVFFVCLDGVLYASVHSSKAVAKIWIDSVIAEAYFHHLDESEILREAHQMALDILKRDPPEMAEKIRSSIRDQKCYGTYKDPRAPNVNICFTEDNIEP